VALTVCVSTVTYLLDTVHHRAHISRSRQIYWQYIL